MTPQDLLTLIQSDTTANSLFSQGKDVECAERCRAIAPKVPKKLQLSKIGLIDVYAAALGLPGAMLAQTILSTVDAVSVGNPLIKTVFAFTAPETHPDSLVDWGNPMIQAMLITPVEQGGCGLTVENITPILNASLVEPSITALDVEFVRKRI